MAALEGSSDHRSLNRETRKKELLKIALENHAILKRLQQKQGSYNPVQLGHEYRKTEQLLRNICEFPYVLAKDMRTNSSVSILSEP